MLKKTRLWRGLIFVATLLLIIAVALTFIFESFKNQIDDFFGTRSEVVVAVDDGTLWRAFTPPDDVLTNGKGDSEKLIKKFIEFGRRQASGGAVLLKNNGALPLASGSDVTLLGLRSHVMLQGAGLGMPIRGAVISFEEALSKDKTDFNNPKNRVGGKFDGLSDFAFDEEIGGAGAGYNLNPTMIATYDRALNNINSDRNTAGMRYTLTGPRQNRNDFDPLEPSLADLMNINADFIDSFASYDDAAIVVVGRPGGEFDDYFPGSKGGVKEGIGAEEPLSLTANERDIIALATEKFEKVIVLVNTTSAMEIDELKENDKIDSILWIGHPGNYGTLGIADILTGKVSPSGGMADIYAANGMSHPATVNMGDYRFANEADALIGARDRSGSYVIEPENIYVGYRYYETRYNDIIEGRGNTDSSVGAVASDGNWNYADEVTYGFGYGLSYSGLTQKIVGEPTITHNAHDFTMDFNVSVTNVPESDGGVAAAANIQLYGQAPYKENGLEKSAIQLLAYEKTRILQPGENVVVPIRVDLQDIASYDMTHDNGNGTKGTWVLDEGKYYFAVGNGAHDALNNILAKQGKTVANTSGKMDRDGDEDKVYEYDYDYGNGEADCTTFAISKNNTEVFNHLDYSDWNYYEEGKITQLSRGNWSGTYPVEYADLEVPDSMIPHMRGKYYDIVTTDDTSAIKFGVEHGMNFYEMKFSDFNDKRWDTLLEQISLSDAMGIIACGGNNFRNIPSVGFVKASLTENSGNGVDLQLFQHRIDGAPWAISETDNNKDYELEVFGCGLLTASSFDPKLQHELGEIVGIQALFVSLPILWGPGLNTHRHPYNGRNGDYYSEDPVLSGVTAMEFAIGALSYGLIAAPKHFAFNDQETNRYEIATFMTEQRAREIELRAFQIAVEANKYDTPEKDAGMLGIMCSFSKIGAVECTASRGLMTDILRNEWGFHGYAVTDISDDLDIYTAVAYAGTTGYDIRMEYTDEGFEKYRSLADGVIPSPELYANDAGMLTAIKNAAHNVLWAFCQSNLMNVYNPMLHSEWRMTVWRGVYISMFCIFGTMFAVAVAFYIISKIGGR